MHFEFFLLNCMCFSLMLTVPLLPQLPCFSVDACMFPNSASYNIYSVDACIFPNSASLYCIYSVVDFGCSVLLLTLVFWVLCFTARSHSTAAMWAHRRLGKCLQLMTQPPGNLVKHFTAFLFSHQNKSCLTRSK